MDVQAAATAITQNKALQTQSDVSTATVKKALDLVKSEAELLIQLIYKSMGIGQNVDALA